MSASKISLNEEEEEEEEDEDTCPSRMQTDYAREVRDPLKNMVLKLCPKTERRCFIIIIVYYYYCYNYIIVISITIVLVVVVLVQIPLGQLRKLRRLYIWHKVL